MKQTMGEIHEMSPGKMPMPQRVPDWAAELYAAFESGACGQFILYGNVHDRLAVGGRLVNIERYIQDELRMTTTARMR